MGLKPGLVFFAVHEILVVASHLGAQAPGTRASVVMALGLYLEQGLSSCGHEDSRSEHVESSWARAGRFLTT